MAGGMVRSEINSIHVSELDKRFEDCHGIRSAGYAGFQVSNHRVVQVNLGVTPVCTR